MISDPADRTFKVNMSGEMDTAEASHEVNCRLVIFIHDGIASWFVNDRKLMHSSDVEFVALSRGMLDVFAGIAIPTNPAVEDVLNRLGALVG